MSSILKANLAQDLAAVKAAVATPTPEQEAVAAVEIAEEEVAKPAIQQTFAEEKAKHNPGSYGRKLVESFAMLADQPVSVGALAGMAIAGAVGGSQAGAASVPIAMKFNQLASTRYNAQQKLGARGTVSKLNQNLIHKETGETLAVINGTVVDQKGQPVPVELQKNLLDTREERQKKQGDKRIENAENRTQISRERLMLSTDQYFDKQDEDADRKKVQMIKQVESNPVYKKTEEALTEVNTIKNLLNDAYEKGGQSLAMLGPKIAKGIAGEVGVLTEQDVTRYVRNPSLVGGLMDTLAKMKSGKITNASKENIERLLDIMERESIRKQENIIEKIGSRYAKSTKDITVEKARDIFTPTPKQNSNSGDKKNKIKSAKAWIAAENKKEKPDRDMILKVMETIQKLEQEGK